MRLFQHVERNTRVSPSNSNGEGVLKKGENECHSDLGEYSKVEGEFLFCHPTFLTPFGVAGVYLVGAQCISRFTRVLLYLPPSLGGTCPGFFYNGAAVPFPCGFGVELLTKKSLSSAECRVRCVRVLAIPSVEYTTSKLLYLEGDKRRSNRIKIPCLLPSVSFKCNLM